MIDLQSATLPLFQSLLVNLQPSNKECSDLFESLILPSSTFRPTTDVSNRCLSCKSVTSPDISSPTNSVGSSDPYSQRLAGKDRKRTNKPHSFNSRQTKTLLSILSYDDQLSQTEKELVGIVLGLTSAQVNRWFCNARARELRRSKKYCELERSDGWGISFNHVKIDKGSQTASDEYTPDQLIDPRLLRLSPSPPSNHGANKAALDQCQRQRQIQPPKLNCGSGVGNIDTLTGTSVPSLTSRSITSDKIVFGSDMHAAVSSNSSSAALSESWMSEGQAMIENFREDNQRGTSGGELAMSKILLDSCSLLARNLANNQIEPEVRDLQYDEQGRSAEDETNWSQILKSNGLGIHSGEQRDDQNDNQNSFNFLNPLSADFLRLFDATPAASDSIETMNAGLKPSASTSTSTLFDLDEDHSNFLDLLNYYSSTDYFDNLININTLQDPTFADDPFIFSSLDDCSSFSQDSSPSTDSSSSSLSSSPSVHVGELTSDF